jgi:hypothetical protein
VFLLERRCRRRAFERRVERIRGLLRRSHGLSGRACLALTNLFRDALVVRRVDLLQELFAEPLVVRPTLGLEVPTASPLVLRCELARA